MAAVAKIEGFKEARETLQSLSATVQRNVGKRALRPAAEVVRDALEAAAPVSTDPHNPTKGSLKAAPAVVPERARKGAPRIAVLVDDKAAVPIEYGTGKMAARPYARQATENAREPAARAFAPALKAEIETAAKRAAKRG
jgi:HK97 gp10 family phage protein